MAIKVAQSFERTVGAPIDASFNLTKAEMLAVNDNFMPEKYFTVCLDDGAFYLYDKSATPSAETGKFKKLEGNGGGGEIGYDFTTNITVGGIAEGTAIAATENIADIIKNMLLTVYYPTYTAPSASLNVPTVLAEVGQALSQNVTLAYNAGAITLRGTKQADRGGAATNYNLVSAGADVEVSQDNTTGTFAGISVTRSAKGNVVLTGKVDYAEGEQPKDSNGRDFETPLAAGDVSASKTIEFIYPFLWGAAATATPDLTTLTKDLKKKADMSYLYDTSDEYIVFAYDSSYGALTSILDQNGFETISGYDTYTDGAYRVYVSQLPTTDTGARNTFKF